jgi:hypothetical protein
MKRKGGIMTVKELRDKVIAEAQWDRSRAVGILRQDIVDAILGHFKDKGIIALYLKTKAFSWADLIDGVDFYIVVIKDQYVTIPISVTGPFWIRDHLKRHPDVPVVSVDLRKGLAKAKAFATKRILRIIKAAR